VSHGTDLFVVVGTGVCTQGFMLARQASSSFCSDYFGVRFSLFAQAGWTKSSYFTVASRCYWDDRYMPHTQLFLLKQGLANVFCLGR
jgi:hypothetical protein